MASRKCKNLLCDTARGVRLSEDGNGARKALRHIVACCAVRDDVLHRCRDARGLHLILQELGLERLSEQDVRQGEARHIDEQPPDEVGECGHPIEDDGGQSHDRRLHDDRA